MPDSPSNNNPSNNAAGNTPNNPKNSPGKAQGTPGNPNPPAPRPAKPTTHQPSTHHAVAHSPEATHAQVDRLASMAGNLRELLDASMKNLTSVGSRLTPDDVFTLAQLRQTEQSLADATDGLDKMSDLVHAAMQTKSLPIGSPNITRARPVTLGESVEHALEVCKPLADRHAVTLAVRVGQEVAHCPAGAMYTVLLNGVQNAIESVARRGGTGRVTLELRAAAPPSDGAYGRDARVWCVVDVHDDGAGLPAGIAASRVFDMGFTTKPHASGVGLAVAKSIVLAMGGSISLADHTKLPRGTADPAWKSGSLLRIHAPCLSPSGAGRHAA